jgi:hypothetical protein
MGMRRELRRFSGSPPEFGWYQSTYSDVDHPKRMVYCPIRLTAIWRQSTVDAEG